jgi:SAM-dependent methyltransferase
VVPDEADVAADIESATVDVSASAYGDAFADVYDEWYADVSDVAATVDRVAALAGDRGRVLELGVGTGRLALPMAAAGLRVVGIDASPAMVERLRAKPGGAGVDVVIGDMADVDELLAADASCDVALIAFNTLFNLPTAAAQRRCLAGAARRLAPSGALLVEAFVPAEAPPAGEVVALRSVAQGVVVLSISSTDPVTQMVTGRYVEVRTSGTRMRSWAVRYASPAEIDGWAVAGGLELVERWAGWRGEPFTDESDQHVSRYRLAGGSPATS